jgi:hypothetical protein
LAFDDLKTLEDVQRFLAERRQVMPHSAWTELVREVAEEMASRTQLPTDRIMQKIGVFKRATDTLPPLPPKSKKAVETGWLVLDGGQGSDGSDA